MTLILVIIIALILYVVLIYNGMVKMRNQVKEAWSDIDVQLKRRYNLIPNIVETVKGYAAHEETVFTEVTEARAKAINAGSVQEQAAAENMLSGALKSLFAVAENYPQLRANENFLQLQNELVDTEDKIQSARRFYNGVVRDFNTKVQQFPASIVAKLFKFIQEEFFEIEDEEQKENVQVSFKDEEGAAAAAAPADASTEVKTKAEGTEPAESAGEKTEEATPTEEAPAEEVKEEEAPAGPEKCPKCGGEMTEGHTCPVEEKEEEAPAEGTEPAESDEEAKEEEALAEEEKSAESDEAAGEVPKEGEAPAEGAEGEEEKKE